MTTRRMRSQETRAGAPSAPQERTTRNTIPRKIPRGPQKQNSNVAQRQISRSLLAAVHGELAIALDREGAPGGVGEDVLERLPFSEDSSAGKFIGALRARMGFATEGTGEDAEEEESALVRLIGRGKKKSKATAADAETVDSTRARGRGLGLGIGIGQEIGLRAYASSAIEESVLAGHTGAVNALAFSHDGALLVSGAGDDSVRIWDLSTVSPSGAVVARHARTVGAVAVSRDGELVASMSWDGLIGMYRRSSDTTLPSLSGHGGSYTRDLAFRSDGHLFSGGTDSYLREWDAAGSAQFGNVYRAHTGNIRCFAITPDEQCIVSGSSDKKICIWDIATQDLIGDPIRLAEDPWAVSVHPTDKTVAVIVPQKLLILSLDTRQPVANETTLGTDGRKCHAVAHSPDGSVLAIAVGSTIELRDSTTGALVRDPIRDPDANDDLNAVVWSPDGRTFATGSRSTKIRLYHFVDEGKK